MKSFKVKIESITPLLQHRMPEDVLFALLVPKNPVKSPKVTETPREIAERYVYKTKDGKYYIPSEYVSGAFKAIASDYDQKKSSRRSYKAIAGGIFRPLEPVMILNDKKGKPLKDFEVDIRKATNHQKGAVCSVRPRFDEWSCEFTVNVDTDLIAEETALTMFQDAGRRAGIGSFRVAKGGYFGQFSVVEWKELN